MFSLPLWALAAQVPLSPSMSSTSMSSFALKQGSDRFSPRDLVRCPGSKILVVVDPMATGSARQTV